MPARGWRLFENDVSRIGDGYVDLLRLRLRLLNPLRAEDLPRTARTIRHGLPNDEYVMLGP